MNKAKIDFIGTYCVWENDPAQIKLTLNENHTYAYQDFSNPQQKIDLTGPWELRGLIIELKHAKLPYNFHHKWRFSEEGKVAKSRNGMSFYGLCKL
ncbi:MAG: hypothetical protein SGJ00_14230 [bacterium]|nr:hypothetical protein [bacterium]